MSKVSNYVKESYDELMHKVSWPTFKELQNSAVVVAVAALILALIVFLMDFITGVQYIPGAHHISPEAQAEQSGWAGLLGYLYSLFF
jgi:preprotein translocase subunit SecE